MLVSVDHLTSLVRRFSLTSKFPDLIDVDDHFAIHFRIDVDALLMADRLHIFILDFLFFFDYNIKSLRLNRIVFLHRLAVLLILILLCLISSLLF